MTRRLLYDTFHWLDNTLYGDGRDDEIRGGDGNDTLYGLGGSDLLLGGDGTDHLFGMSGDDELKGGSGDDWLSGGAGDDKVYGDAGDDRVYIDKGNNSYDGGTGYDTFWFLKTDVNYIIYSNGIATANTTQNAEFGFGFSVDLESGETWSGSNGDFTTHWGTNTFKNFQVYNMTDDDDVFRGNNAGHNIYAGGGDDVVEGRGGGDYISGGSGSDTASYESSNASVQVNLGTNTGLGGDAKGDTFQSIENLIGSAHNDTLVGDAGANKIEGGAGDDQIVGSGGRDVLIGGAGVDTFAYQFVTDSAPGSSTRDVIKDFRPEKFIPELADGGDLFHHILVGSQVNGDEIDLSAIDANQTATSSGNQAFTFIGTADFTAAGQVRYFEGVDADENRFYVVQANVDNDMDAEFAVTVFVTDDIGLSVDDFIF